MPMNWTMIIMRLLLGIMLFLLTIPCASRTSFIIASTPQRQDVSHLVPSSLTFATQFVQTLSDAGWIIEQVAGSKFNGGMMGTEKAAWVKTDRGVLEVLFFENREEVQQIQIKEEADSTPTYHKYTVTRGSESHPWQGRLPVYFTKYRTMLIVSCDQRLADALNKLFANQD